MATPNRLFVQRTRQTPGTVLVLLTLTLAVGESLFAQNPTLTIGNEIFKKAEVTGTGLIPNSSFVLVLCVEKSGTKYCSGVSGITNSDGNFVLTYDQWFAFCDICNPPPNFLAEEATIVIVRFSSTDFLGFKPANVPDGDPIFVSLNPGGSLVIGPREFSKFSIAGDGFPQDCNFGLLTDTMPIGLGGGSTGSGSWRFAFGNGEAINTASYFVWKGNDDSCPDIFTGSTIPGGPYPKIVVLSIPATISGTVSDYGSGLQGVLVKLRDEFGLPVDGFDDIFTDVNGEYSFVDVPAGNYQVTIEHPSEYTADLNPKPAVVVAHETTTVDFNLTCSSSYWTPTSLTNAPPAQAEFRAVWTGNKMIVWGGQGAGEAGGIYDPAFDTWIPTSTVNVPTARSEHIALWTGSKMIVWGGRGAGNTGGIYDPVTDTWAATSTTNAPANGVERVAVWTGSKMLIWGGDASSIGGIYDPVTDLWSTISTVDAPTPREETVAVWTGSKMIVRGDESDGIYDPITDTWSSITPVNAPTFGGDGVAVWTGNKMIVWGGKGTNEGGIYDPVTDTWSAMTTNNAPAIREDAVAFWTGSKMIVWGGGGSPSTETIVNSGGIYDPVIDAWTETSTCKAPSPRENFAAVWTGSKMIVWGGNAPNGITNTGGIYSYPNTAAGTNVQITLSDATITFSQVDQTGTTSLETSTTGPPPPNGFALGNPATYYDLTTTAIYSGAIEICIDYSEISFGDESQLNLFHFEDGQWVDRTSSLDTDANIICATVTSLSPFAILKSTTLVVDIDIKPGDAENPINLKSKGVIPVVILTTEDFDATTVDPLSVTFGPDGATEAHNKGHIEDADGDGDLDLILHFKTQSTGIQCGDTEASLTGLTFDAVPVAGTDVIQTVECILPKTLADEHADIPDAYALFQNYPNPFNPETEIRFALPEAIHVMVQIFNTLGKEIRTLTNRTYAAGFHTLRWDGKDQNGNPVSSGVYLYRLQAGTFVQVKKMNLVQ